MDDECRPEPGPRHDLGGGSWFQVVALWPCPDGRAWRVVRWQLRDAARLFYGWARGSGVTAGSGAGPSWIMGVALEQQDTPAGRWSTLRRQELDNEEPVRCEARLQGWQAGLLDPAGRLVRKRAHEAPADATAAPPVIAPKRL